MRNLSATAVPRPVLTRVTAPVHTAALSALTASSFCGVPRSARLKTDEMTAPATNPICTEAVSHAAAVAPMAHSERRPGATAAAENHTHRPSTSTTAMSARCVLACHFIVEFPSGC